MKLQAILTLILIYEPGYERKNRYKNNLLGQCTATYNFEFGWVRKISFLQNSHYLKTEKNLFAMKKKKKKLVISIH